MGPQTAVIGNVTHRELIQALRRALAGDVQRDKDGDREYGEGGKEDDAHTQELEDHETVQAHRAYQFRIRYPKYLPYP